MALLRPAINMIMKFNQEYADLLSSGNDICIDNQLATVGHCQWHKVFRPLEAANQIFMKCVVFNADDTLCLFRKVT